MNEVNENVLSGITDNVEESSLTDDNSSETPIELTELLSSDYNYSKSNKERLSDIIVTQITICIILILALVIINIFRNDITSWFIEEFKKLSGKETETFFEKTVNEVMNYING